MRKILLVQNECYLDRALQDVSNLIGFERRSTNKDGVVDLLAVILMSPSAIARLISEDQTCELSHLANSTPLFSPDSISVNGMWLLITVSQPDLLEPTARQEALGRILNILRSKGCVESLNTVFPAFPSEEVDESIAEQMSYLGYVHPGLPATNALNIDAPGHQRC